MKCLRHAAKCLSFAGHVRVMTTGASPISEEVFDFLRVCFGATVLEGYGMTETACVISEMQPGDATAGLAGLLSLDCVNSNE